MAPLLPTNAPTTISKSLFNMKPVTEAAQPEYEFNIETTTGISAPPIDATRWTPNRNEINNIINKGINEFIEVGPGKVLSGLVKRIDRDVKVKQVNTLKDMENLIND